MGRCMLGYERRMKIFHEIEDLSEVYIYFEKDFRKDEKQMILKMLDTYHVLSLEFLSFPEFW